MKTLPVLLLPLFATTLFAQTTPSQNPAAACGPDGGYYKVTLSKNNVIPSPKPGMAVIVFVEDEVAARPARSLCLGKCPTTQMRFGIDGQWVAVTEGFSHLAVSVAPGEHHFCASADSTEVASFNSLSVQAGKTYFLQGRLALNVGEIPYVDLSALNDDEGRYITYITKESFFTAKK